MKKLFLQSLTCLLVVSCSVQDYDTPDTNASSQDVFYAYLESYSEPDTRVYINEKIKILWDAKDQISLFKSTWNQKYEFKGNTGDSSGEFKDVSTGFGTGNDIAFICAVYPYQSSTTIDNKDELTLEFPAEQIYREGSFGRGANTMLSVTKTKEEPLMFKNAGGYLVLKFHGKDVSISSVTLEGRNEEPLSGNATWKPVVGAVPKFTFASTAGTSITLTCNEPVTLGATKEEATVFWMVVPPTPFEKGFKLTVTGADGKSFIKETDKNLAIVRNTLLRIAPVEVKFD
ncbi:MAG: hypothetical protein IKG84_08565 [Bacteroidales bacterium]|nr:hypothetical protein [Bacteroidales bacterium]